MEFIPHDFWRNRRVFVTGATGLVGSWLVKDLLAAEAKVIALVRNPASANGFYRLPEASRVTVVCGTVEDYASLEKALGEHAVDTVFHLAAQPIVSVAHRQPWPTFEANIRGTYNLLEACRVQAQSVQRVVLASSYNAYGQQEQLPYTEEMPLRGQHPYEVSSSCASLLAKTYHHTFGLPVAILRCGNIFGGGDLNWSRLVPYTIRCCLNRERPVVRSDGLSVRDYIYVQDVSRCYLKTAECLTNKQIQGEAFNLSLERPVTVLEMIRTIQQLMGCLDLPPDVQNNASGEIRAQYLSSAKVRRSLNWTPQFNLEQGLRETIAWYRNYLATQKQTA